MYLFTYGTLRRGLRGFAKGVSVGEGTIKGTLIDLHAFPGVLLSADPNAPTVHGMLWRLTDLGDEDPFADLDYYEGLHQKPPLYHRRQTTVTLDDGSAVENVWVYEFNTAEHDFDGKFGTIPSGDWFNKGAA